MSLSLSLFLFLNLVGLFVHSRSLWVKLFPFPCFIWKRMRARLLNPLSKSNGAAKAKLVWAFDQSLPYAARLSCCSLALSFPLSHTFSLTQTNYLSLALLLVLFCFWRLLCVLLSSIGIHVALYYCIQDKSECYFSLSHSHSFSSF